MRCFNEFAMESQKRRTYLWKFGALDFPTVVLKFHSWCWCTWQCISVSISNVKLFPSAILKIVDLNPLDRLFPLVQQRTYDSICRTSNPRIIICNILFLSFQFESRLLQCPVRKPGYFTDIEFAEAIDSFVPLASERLLHRLFTQSVKHFPEANDTVNVGRISRILYLPLLFDYLYQSWLCTKFVGRRYERFSTEDCIANYFY